MLSPGTSKFVPDTRNPFTVPVVVVIFPVASIVLVTCKVPFILALVPVNAAKVVFPVAVKSPALSEVPVIESEDILVVPLMLAAVTSVPVNEVIVAAGPEKEVVALTLAPLTEVVPITFVPVTEAEDKSVVNLPVVPVTAPKVVEPVTFNVPVTDTLLVAVKSVAVNEVIVAAGPEKEVVALTVPPRIFVPVTFTPVTVVALTVVIVAAGPENSVVALTLAPLTEVVPTTFVPVTDAEDTLVIPRISAPVIVPVVVLIFPVAVIVPVEFNVPP